MPAPITLFAYKRLYELQCTVKALQANYLATFSELYIFVDGPRREEDKAKVNEVRQFVKQITGFQKIYLKISEQNKGCAKSVIEGVSYVLRQHPTVIVVEDDIVTAPNFLNYVNQALEQYRSNERVFSIGAYTFPFRHPAGYKEDVYFYGRTCAWGWGIWADRWFKTDWNIADYDDFINDNNQRKAFNYYGSDRVRMLQRTVKKEVDTWDILLCYNQFKQKTLTVFPTISKVDNIGFYSNDGANTNVFNRYQTILDEGVKRLFIMPDEVTEQDEYTQQFRNKFSIKVRLINRLKTYAGMR